MQIKLSLQSICSLICSLAFTSIVLSAKVSESATYYVATAGSDANSCTAGSQVKAKRTIVAGLGCLVAGDTLLVKGGTYTEALINVIPSGTTTSPITLAAASGEVVTIAAPAGAARVIEFPQSAHDIIIDGFILDGMSIALNVIKSYGANRVQIRNSEIRNARNAGILGGGSAWQFIRLKVHNNGSVDAYGPGYPGVYWGGDQTIIEWCEVYNQRNGPGIGMWSSGDTAALSGNIVRYNKSYNNKRNALAPYTGRHDAHGIYCGSQNGTNNCLIYNNIVYGNDIGIGVVYNAINTKVYNNTVYANTSAQYGACIDTYHSASGTEVKNNICWQNVMLFSDNGRGTVFSNNLTSNPLFVNAAANNFYLQPGSPAIDAGVVISEVLFDHSGVRRPQGNSYDIGAYEYANSQLLPPSNFRILGTQ
jgi:hypothetical protein